ncbi:MAG TPA: LuxR C-terminal-related transcriptional regulator [Polyangiales bacterium]|nr:LuxR C-terminal-related transcriptional regulator [Polyangiales bacterium]
MLPFQFLDMVDGLTRLDPVRTYPVRAGELVARLCGVDAFIVELDGGETATSDAVPEGRTKVSLPLRYGRQTLGQVVLLLPEGKERLEPHDLRTARWAARIMGRCLNYSARMRHEPRKNGLEEVSEALHKAPLTPRERDVVALLMSGASTRQIAAETHLTVGTVHTYLKRIYPKLGVRSRVELVARMIGTDGLTFGPGASILPPQPAVPVVAVQPGMN